MIVALCGGVGGSKLALGLYRVLPPDELTVIVNTADDLEFCGLHVSPDVDTVIYTLAGMARRDVGWGIEGDTDHALDMLRRYGLPDWFQVGDRDLATHLYRTHRLGDGLTLTEVVTEMAHSLGIRASVLPMTNQSVKTRLLVGDEWLDFQDYFVRRRHRDRVEEIRFEGAEKASPGPGVLSAIREADAIIFVNSNPVLSILPILSVPGVRQALLEHGEPRVAVSPIVGRSAVSGPAAQLLKLIGGGERSMDVASLYSGLIGGIVIENDDSPQREEIEKLGMRVLCTDTIMRVDSDRERLAADVLTFAGQLP